FIYVTCGCVICIFCNFGPLYLVKVCPNAALVEPGFYAPVKYFSAAQASKAQRVTHGRGFLQSSPLKVKEPRETYSHPLTISAVQDEENIYQVGNGKVVVGCRMERDYVLQDDDLEELVNDIPWSQFDPDGQEENEDIPWELSVNM
uniref:Uncharacterized protein n=1 Tax=Oncorhynchus mykiss TaxID=8022 RepID=A0A8K9UI39_ONCMY